MQFKHGFRLFRLKSSFHSFKNVLRSRRDLFFVSGDRSILPQPDPEEEKLEEERRKQAESVGLRASSPREKKPLAGASTHYFVGTEDGEIIYLDWTLEKDADTGKLVREYQRIYRTSMMFESCFLACYHFFFAYSENYINKLGIFHKFSEVSGCNIMPCFVLQ